MVIKQSNENTTFATPRVRQQRSKVNAALTCSSRNARQSAVCSHNAHQKYLNSMKVWASDEPQLSPVLLKVVNDSPAGAKPQPGVAERHLIPYVHEIFMQLDASAKTAHIEPPSGLLTLGRQQFILDIICDHVMVRPHHSGCCLSCTSSHC